MTQLSFTKPRCSKREVEKIDSPFTCCTVCAGGPTSKQVPSNVPTFLSSFPR